MKQIINKLRWVLVVAILMAITHMMQLNAYGQETDGDYVTVTPFDEMPGKNVGKP